MAKGDLDAVLRNRERFALQRLAFHFALRNCEHPIWREISRTNSRMYLHAAKSARHQLRALEKRAATAATAAER